MNKKTALVLACEELEKNKVVASVMCETCPDKGKCELCNGAQPTKARIWKQYFQQQANIPDGWDVVKEIYEIIIDDIDCIEKELSHSSRESENKEIKIETLKDVSYDIEKYLKQAGIEVGEVAEVLGLKEEN